MALVVPIEIRRGGGGRREDGYLVDPAHNLPIRIRVRVRVRGLGFGAGFAGISPHGCCPLEAPFAHTQAERPHHIPPLSAPQASPGHMVRRKNE